MTKNIIYALDFDGVICHSAIETAITGWKAAQDLWPDKKNQDITQQDIDNFCYLRPLIETGYEAILIMYYLQKGGLVDNMFASYQEIIDETIIAHNLNTDDLKILFGQTRDQWINENKIDWLSNNSLFAGITEKLKALHIDHWHIITTKQEHFVHYILQGHDIYLSDDHVYGLDCKMSKQEVLIELLEQYPEKEIIFIEDRLATLIGILNNPKLNTIRLQLVDWGYNSTSDREVAKKLGITVITQSEFLNSHKNLQH
ncbi:MAG: HAD family hydrolase [Thiotrichaceae bacterium]|nr:HAD family hydrolase [Thiotrichaceae bacterium]